MQKARMTALLERRGAVRRDEIPVEVLAALGTGQIQAITLVEWVAIDPVELARTVLPEVGLGERLRELVAAAELVADQGITRRLRGMGEALFHALREHPRRSAVAEALGSHRADMVRAWAVYTVAAERGLELPARLQAMRRFAVDKSGWVRDCAADAIRPYVVADLDRGLRALVPWVLDLDPDVRRCAIEATRPRGVWQKHVAALKQDPQLASALLEPLRSDPDRRVQRAVASWLNDASRSQPQWVRALCRRWEEESPTEETAWIVAHALRTLRRR